MFAFFPLKMDQKIILIIQSGFFIFHYFPKQLFLKLKTPILIMAQK